MRTSIIIVLGLLVSVTTAHADSADSSNSPEDKQHGSLTTGTQFLPEQVVRRPLVLTHGMVELAVHAEANLSRKTNFEPLSLAPDLRYGVTDRLTIGLVHSNAAVGFVGAVGNGLCLGGARPNADPSMPAVCAHLYNSTGLEGVYSLSAGASPWALAVRGYAMVRGHGSTQAFGATSGAGARARWTKDRLAVQLDPALAIDYTDGGDTELLLQFYANAQYQLSSRFAASAGAGYYGPVDEMGALPLTLGMLFAVDKNIDVAANAALMDVSDSIDARSLTISFSYRM